MLYTSFRRTGRARLGRLVCFLALILGVLDYLHIAWITSSSDLPVAHIVSPGKVFIASIHWNNEPVLRSHWNDAVVGLVKKLGPENVYVSILESGSWDDSKGALRELDAALGELGVGRTVRLDEGTHADELQTALDRRREGWIETGRGDARELRRIPYLARLRNVSLRPLWEMEEKGVGFDRVLFLNDVVFTPDDVLTLINTREGNYAAACSLDFSKPPSYYDTFALRDSRGLKTATSSYPYFASSESRNALLAGHAVPVQSCWNGMVVFDAAPFYNGTTNVPGLRFRGIDDSLAMHHLEGSECCLIHYDNPLARRKGVYLNPHVRVGYTPASYAVVAAGGPPQDGTTHAVWPSSAAARVTGIWLNRLVRLGKKFQAGLETSNVRRRVRRWQSQDAGRHEPGVSCLINEMQVLIANGWAHV